MIRIKVRLGIGYPGADHEDIIEVEDDHFDDMTGVGMSEALYEIWNEWAWEYIEYYACIVEES